RYEILLTADRLAPRLQLQRALQRVEFDRRAGANHREDPVLLLAAGDQQALDLLETEPHLRLEGLEANAGGRIEKGPARAAGKQVAHLHVDDQVGAAEKVIAGIGEIGLGGSDGVLIAAALAVVVAAGVAPLRSADAQAAAARVLAGIAAPEDEV